MGTNYYDRRNIYSDDDILACYLNCNSQIKAAEILGISRETVARAVRRKGVKLTGRKFNGRNQNQTQTKITDAQLIEAAKTKTTREIATEFDMSEERVYRRAKKLDLCINSCGSGGHWRRRALRYGCSAFDDTISLKALIKRDKGICQICGAPTNEDDLINGHIGRMYPTLDHIIPLSKGGTHTWDNVQLAHMACNAGKCDKVNGGKI